MAKYWWDDDDDDDESDDEESYYDEKELYLTVNNINEESLTKHFNQIIELQSDLNQIKLIEDPRFAARQIQNRIDYLTKYILQLNKNLEIVVELRGIINHYLVDLNRNMSVKQNTYDAWNKLQAGLDEVDRQVMSYEYNGLTDKPEFNRLKERQKVMQTLARMRTIEEVQKYLNNYNKKYEDCLKKEKEKKDEISSLEQEKSCLDQKQISSASYKKISEQEQNVDAQKNLFLHNFQKYIIVHPNANFVTKMKNMVGIALFFGSFKLPLEILTKGILNKVVDGVCCGKIKNEFKPTKNTDLGR